MIENGVRVEKEIGGRMLSLESGKIAKQADGAVLVQYADTVVLAAVQSATPRAGIDWFPLFIDYREKFQAAGKIPGGRFYKREGRPSLKEVLTMRMTDRPLRPLFPENYKDEVQVMTMALSADAENDPDILAMIASAAALCISSMPFDTPVGSIRVGRVEGELVLNPTTAEREEGDLDLVLSANGDDIIMIEAESDEVSEEDMLEAIRFGREAAKDVSELIRELTSSCAKEKAVMPSDEAAAKVAELVKAEYAGRIEEAVEISDKKEKSTALSALREEVAAGLVEKEEIASVEEAFGPFDNVMRGIVRRRILAGKRSDGRSPNELRPLSSEVGILPRTHGSALFTRGETQVLSTVTLGTNMDEEWVESIVGDYKRKFMLHYNFPPFSVGEVKPVRGPSRRDLGHGALAEKALSRVIPDKVDFPYTIRIVADVMESNGSSSMATVCGATLSLMDAGVTIEHPIAGISVGLVEEGNERILLTDIQGEEDHYGDMDFKVAGTQNGIAAIQLDIKTSGICDEVVAGALVQAKEARLEILRHMLSVIPRPRGELSAYAPKIVKIMINPEKIGMVIGSGGKVVRKLQEDTGATIELEDDGTVTISGTEMDAINAAREAVEKITEEPEIGKVYTGRVRGIKDFGAFVEILPGTDGLLHISEIANERVVKVTDFVRMGDTVTVKCIGIDQGKIRLSRKALLSEEKE